MTTTEMEAIKKELADPAPYQVRGRLCARACLQERRGGESDEAIQN